MKIIKRIFNCLIILFLAVWVISLCKCEILTYLHGHEFSEIYNENAMLGEIEYFRVLKYSSDFAEVYYVGKDHCGGDILTFVKENKKWKYSGWETVWSGSGGSASEVIWPYWWHFIYGGI